MIVMRTVVAALCMVVVLWSWVGCLAGDSATDVFAEGKRFLEAGEHDKAVDAFTKVLGILDGDSRNAHVVLVARAQAYFGKGNVGQSLKDVMRVLQSDSADGEMVASALNLRGSIHRGEGRDKQAVDDFTKAIKTLHDNETLRATCFANRGVTFISLGQPDRAVTDLGKAIELNPDNGYAYAWRAQAFLRQDDIDLAKRDAEHALNLNPDDQTRKVAERVLKEMELTSSSPSEVSVPLAQNGHVFVQLRFSKGGAPHRFMLDTGATDSLVDRELIDAISKETEVKEIGKGLVRIADGSAHRVIRYRVQTAYLLDLSLGPIDLYAFEKKGRKIMNLLGMGSMKTVSVSIDRARKIARITRTGAD
jgi:tetratricopeptide (TPR) repeat protein